MLPPTVSRTTALLGTALARRLGSLIMLLGALLVVYAALWQTGIAPGSRVSVPLPEALAGAGGSRQVSAAARDAAPVGPGLVSERSVDVRPAAPTTGADRRSTDLAAGPPQSVADADERVAGRGLASTAAGSDRVEPLASPARRLVAADHDDRAEAAARPAPGYAVRLAIPSIGLETEVRQAGVKAGRDGRPEWETLPFVAAHYGDFTALVGGRGNAVIAGHVATLYEGNVFWTLYRVGLDDEIQVWDERNRLHPYRVVEVKLVDPSDVSVVELSPGRLLTLITCGGTFDPVRREFSDRLVVVATAAD